MKERLRGYFRLSGRPCDKKTVQQQRSSDISMGAENTTETCDEPATPRPLLEKSTEKRPVPTTAAVASQQQQQKKQTLESKSTVPGSRSKIITISDARQNPKSRLNGEFSESLKERLAVAGLLDRSNSIDPLTNSCSNITSSTYCNGNVEHLDAMYFEKNPLCDSLFSVGIDTVIKTTPHRPFLQHQHQMHQQPADPTLYSQDGLSDHVASRRESSSTYERDMDIIDLLERERSMDIQDMLERERRGVDSHKMRSISRQGSSVERAHRKLPDISRLTTAPASPKRDFPNLVFTHQAAVTDSCVGSVVQQRPHRNSVERARPSSQVFYPGAKRDSTHSTASASGRAGIIDEIDVTTSRSSRDSYRLARTRSNGSAASANRSGGGGGSVKSRRLINSVGEYRDPPLYSP